MLQLRRVIIMKITANAKINLSLDVIRKRPDNYHDVKMIMQTLEFGDTVEIEKTGGKSDYKI